MDTEEPDNVAARALANFKRDAAHWGEIYTKAKEDLHFLSDDKYAQWDQKDYDERMNTGRPALVIDQLSQFVHQVSNDIRQNTPTFTVIPDDQESSEESAEAFRAVIRGIEYKSNADDVYDTAAGNAVKCSIGYIRIDHDYCYDQGFDQELQIKRVINPLACYIDANSIECDGRDAMHGTILDKIKVSEFKKKFPGKEVCSFEPEYSGTSKNYKDEDEIQYAEYFEILEEEKEIAVDEYGNTFDYVAGAVFKAKRAVKSRKVMRYKLSGKDVLEETSFPGKYIPLIPVYGEEHWQEGQRSLLSLIRKAKGAQMMYNVWKSLETEIIMKQPNAPVMAAEGQVEDYSADWKNPAKAMVLRYKTKDAEGNALPPPQRLAPPSVPAGIINAAREAVDDIKASMGLYNASIGQRSNETSGVAINQRKQEGDVATFHFYDNLVRSITHVYRVLISAIPEIYDTARIVMAVGSEEEPKKIGINGMAVDGETYDLTKGQYNVRVVPGASYTTKRQEAAAFFTDIVSKQPDLMQVMGDLLFKNMDFAGADAMAERMKKVIDPKFLEGDKNAPPPDPEKEQMKQIIEQGAQELESLQGQIEQKDTQAQMEKMQADIKASLDQLKAEEQIARLTIESLKKDLRIEQLQAEKQLQAQRQSDEEEMLEAFLGPEDEPAQEITQG